MNSLPENSASDGFLENGLHNRPEWEETAVDESSMAPTSIVKGPSKQNTKKKLFSLIEYVYNDNRINWKDFMLQSFFFASFIHLCFYFHAIQISKSYRAFAQYSKL